MQKARGSAIVIAMLLVTAVGAVGFTFGKVLSIQITNQSLYENGVGAYYSAESGIEEGFLRYRYSRDSQVPSFSSVPHPAQSWLSVSKYAVRTDLTLANIVSGGVDKASAALYASQISPFPNDQFYDLRMGSTSTLGSPKGSVSGNPDLSTPAADPDFPINRISRDGTRKIDLGKIFKSGIDSDITLNFKITPGTTVAIPPSVPANHKCTLVEAKLELQPVSGPIIEKKKLLANSSGTCSYNGIITDFSDVFKYSITPVTGVITIPHLKTEIAKTTPYDQATLFLKPIGSDIDYSLTETNTAGPVRVAQNPLKGANSLITSTGYFGGINRTLEANIDLASGSLYDLYDYVIYKN